MNRTLVRVAVVDEQSVDAVLSEHRDWRVVGFNVTQGGVGGYATTAWILFERDAAP